MKQRNFENFIDAYMELARGQESTRKVQKWVALSIIAGAIGRKAWVEHGHDDLAPNLFIVVIAPSGKVRKSTSTRLGVNLLTSLDTTRMFADHLTSAAMVERMLSGIQKTQLSNGEVLTHSSIFAYGSELIQFLGTEVKQEIKTMLTDLYDPKKKFIKHTKSDGEMEIPNPCLNMLGASTPEWMRRSLGAEDMATGFAARILFVVENSNPDFFVAWPGRSRDKIELRNGLIQDLEQISQMTGTFHKSQGVQEYFDNWYEQDMKSDNATDPRFSGYYSRKSIFLIKLAMVLSAAENNSKLLHIRHFEKAIDLLDELEPDMVDAFGNTGLNIHYPIMLEIKDFLRRHHRVSEMELIRKFVHDVNEREREQIIRDMEKASWLKRELFNGKTFYASCE